MGIHQLIRKCDESLTKYPMRILLLTPGAYGVTGGIALYNRDIIEAIASMPETHEVVVLPREVQMVLEIIPSNVRFIAEAAGRKTRFIVHCALAMMRSYDLVICGHINLAPLAVAVAKRACAPLVMMVYGIDVWNQPSRISSFWLKSFDSIWTISDLTCNRMNDWAQLPKPVYTVLPNAIHLDRYGMQGGPNNIRERLRLNGRKVLLTVARLPGFDRYKGVDEILECLPDLVKIVPKLSYVIVGDGDDRRRLEDKARQLGVMDRVVFTGYIHEREKADYFRMADLFVLPGRGEGFGFVFLEALACGVPVIGSRIDGSREALLSGKLGELVDPRNLVEVKEAILRGLEIPKSIPEGLSYFAWPMFTKRVQAAVRTLTSRQP